MKLFVWDFHGTLEKGNEIAAWEISNLALAFLGYHQRFTKSDCLLLYGKKWYEYFETLLPDEPQERHLQLQEVAFRISLEKPRIIASHIRPNDHAHAVLTAIAAAHQQIIISHTIPLSLNLFIEAVDMKHYFPEGFVFAANAHGREVKRTKQQVLQEFLLDKKYDDIVIIGDSPQDLNLALVNGGVTYLYAHPGKPFRDCPADYKIRDLREVLRGM